MQLPIPDHESAAQVFAHLQRLAERSQELGEVEVLTVVPHADEEYPVLGMRFGRCEPGVPVLLIVAGVHGLERIGTEVALAFLDYFLAHLEWDRSQRERLEHCGVLFVPLVNPVGLALRRRSNGNGIDLMRNAPRTSPLATTPLVGGQGISARLPWYTGRPGAPMEAEAEALVAFAEKYVCPSPSAIALDLHSGVGLVDRIWFPYARSRETFPSLAEVFALDELLERSLPHHIYHLEPQALSYTVMGDLWDFIYDRYREAQERGVLLPLTLEMGSWLWVRKRPRQALNLLGSFNPMVPHRLKRTLRRHLPLFELLLRAIRNPDSWITDSRELQQLRFQQALARFYGKASPFHDWPGQ